MADAVIRTQITQSSYTIARIVQCVPVQEPSSLSAVLQ
jgi:hypothetical protein